ncbi:MAG: hypothetical protein AAGA63_14070 [Pseudomonadota bacterium]
MKRGDSNRSARRVYDRQRQEARDRMDRMHLDAGINPYGGSGGGPTRPIAQQALRSNADRGRSGQGNLSALLRKAWRSTGAYRVFDAPSFNRPIGIGCASIAYRP